jgi:hypothetical protein
MQASSSVRSPGSGADSDSPINSDDSSSFGDESVRVREETSSEEPASPVYLSLLSASARTSQKVKRHKVSRCGQQSVMPEKACQPRRLSKKMQKPASAAEQRGSAAWSRVKRGTCLLSLARAKAMQATSSLASKGSLVCSGFPKKLRSCLLGGIFSNTFLVNVASQRNVRRAKTYF